MSSTEHVLPEAALQGREPVDLPPATLTSLTTVGVPAELRLAGWRGPVLFHSELGEGRLVSTADAGAPLSRKGEHEGYLIGSVQDSGGDRPERYSMFVLRRGKGDVYLLDIGKPEDDRFVNSSLDAFLAAMDAFHTAFHHFAAGSPAGQAMMASFRALLDKIDPQALAADANYWPGWLDELA